MCEDLGGGVLRGDLGQCDCKASMVIMFLETSGSCAAKDNRQHYTETSNVAGLLMLLLLLLQGLPARSRVESHLIAELVICSCSSCVCSL